MVFIFCRNKVAACAKHFVGDGGTQNGINENNTVIDRRGLMNIHMPAYFDSLRKGVSTVMISYSSWNGEKMHANHDLINRFLKGKLNFKVKIFQMQMRVTLIPVFRCSQLCFFLFRDSPSQIGKASTGSPVLLEQTTPTLSRLQFSRALTW
jgi:hypothetical protein